MAISKIGSDGLNQAGDTILCADSGNVGIATSSPAQKLHIDGILLFENNKEIRFKDSGATQRTAIAMSSNDLNIGTSAGGNLKFYNGSSYTERARINSGGQVNINTTGNTDAFLVVNGGGNHAIRTLRDGTAGATQISFANANGSVGSISTSGSATAYNTSSDYRLKEDWVAVADASTRVNALKPVNFAWKVDGKRVDGFLAHELAEVVPEAVSGEKDAVELVDIKDEDGNVTGQEERPVYQGIDQSKLVPLLTAALQEALAKIDDLTARVSALEAS
jgi:hypothetical protein